MKLATDAALRENFWGLAELGRMLILLPCSSVLCNVATDATSLNCDGVYASFTDTFRGALPAGVFPSAMNSVTPDLDFSPNLGTNFRCAESSFWPI